MRALLLLTVLLVGALSIFGYQVYREQLGKEHVLQVENAQLIEQTELLRENLKHAQQVTSNLANIDEIYGDFYDVQIDADLNRSYGETCSKGRNSPEFVDEELLIKKLNKTDKLIGFCQYGEADNKVFLFEKETQPGKVFSAFFNSKTDTITNAQQYPISLNGRYCGNISHSSLTDSVYIRCDYPGAPRIYKLSVNTRDVWAMKACYVHTNKTVCATGCRSNLDCAAGQTCSSNSCLTVKTDTGYEVGPYY